MFEIIVELRVEFQKKNNIKSLFWDYTAIARIIKIPAFFSLFFKIVPNIYQFLGEVGVSLLW